MTDEFCTYISQLQDLLYLPDLPDLPDDVWLFEFLDSEFLDEDDTDTDTDTELEFQDDNYDDDVLVARGGLRSPLFLSESSYALVDQCIWYH